MTISYNMKHLLLAISLLLALPGSLMASPFPKTSYEVLGNRNPRSCPGAALFVLVDQSVNYDEALKAKTMELVRNWTAEGRAVEIYSFSSALPGRYTTRITGGRFDDQPSDEYLDNLKRSDRERFISLHSRQPLIARKVVRLSLQEAFAGSRNEIQRTDIVRTMKEMSDYIRTYPGTKSILLVSDMMENSSMASFYFKGRTRLIDPVREMQKFTARQMTGNFGGKVRVYILGLGFYGNDASPAKSEQYLDVDRINAIAAFWRSWFRNSGAYVVETGKPMMFGSIR